MNQEEDPITAIARRELFSSNARDLLDAAKTKHGFEVLYPEGKRKLALLPSVSRFVGPIPDAYDFIAAGVGLEYARSLHVEIGKVFGLIEDGKEPASFEWTRVVNHPILHALEELTISMGGGKGRKEGVEMSKSNQPQPSKPRWSWSRER